MKQLLLSLLTIALACYACTSTEQPAQPANPSPAAGANKTYDLKNDSFSYYYNIASTSKDSLEISRAYYKMALIQRDAGDFFGSQETLSEALKQLDEQNDSHNYALFRTYAVIGNNCVSLKNYDCALQNYIMARRFITNPASLVYTLNGEALVYQKKRMYAEAIRIYDSIVSLSKDNKSEYPRVLSNRARTKWMQDSTYPALNELHTALSIRQQLKDGFGINASYAHLVDYYTSSRPDSAVWYARKRYVLAQQLKSPDDRLETLRQLIKLSHPQEAKQYSELYYQLSDSLQTLKDSAKNQFALIRYGAEKTKAEKLRLEKENTERKVQIIRQRAGLYITAGLFILGAVLAYYWYRKRRQRMEREKQDAIRENELRLSQKVHDVVANGLYAVMAGLEHGPDIRKEQLLDRLEVLYEKSRAISYEKPATPAGGFQETITDMLTSFSGARTKISIVGNHNDLWNQVSANTKKELEHILKELMVNMKKHSRAEKVVVKFERQGNEVRILYQDDGVGLSPSFNYGNGLTNTENRIKTIGGAISFDQASKNGLRIRISFPIAQTA